MAALFWALAVDIFESVHSAFAYPSPMPSRRSRKPFDPSSLNYSCPRCSATITPAENTVLDLEGNYRCVHCTEVFNRSEVVRPQSAAVAAQLG